MSSSVKRKHVSHLVHRPVAQLFSLNLTIAFQAMIRSLDDLSIHPPEIFNAISKTAGSPTPLPHVRHPRKPTPKAVFNTQLPRGLLDTLVRTVSSRIRSWSTSFVCLTTGFTSTPTRLSRATYKICTFGRDESSGSIYRALTAASTLVLTAGLLRISSRSLDSQSSTWRMGNFAGIFLTL